MATHDTNSDPTLAPAPKSSSLPPAKGSVPPPKKSAPPLKASVSASDPLATTASMASPAKSVPPTKTPPAKLPPKKGDKQTDADGNPILDADGRGGGASVFRRVIRSMGACTVSMIFHGALILFLGVLMLGDQVANEITNLISDVYEEELDEDELVEYELQQEIDAATEMAVSAAASASAPSAAEGGGVGDPGPPTIDSKLLASVDSGGGANVGIGPPATFMPGESYMIQDVPDGARGDERFLVDNVDQAMSQITRELLQMLEKSDVLVIWSFDMSESMEEERREIRDRINRVYVELGLAGKSGGDRLTTAVTSYGSKFFVNTKRPTSDLDEIRAAIDSVQNDATGEEMMCQAIGEAISRHSDYAKKTKRQTALILLTDESGDPQNNNMYLEQAVAEAKAAKCRIYTLGRESVFGYPHARMRWIHPQTKRTHWLLVDRGPETAFVEQLQIDGFRRRHDAFSSGFGPYEQCRMANETGGIFFMLPSVESDIVAGEKQHYDMEALRAYRPDLRSKLENYEDRDVYPLRTFLWNVVFMLNPLDQKNSNARDVEVRVHFSLDLQQFAAQAQQEQIRAIKLIQFLRQAENTLLENKRLREQEADPRWQANYDLMLAQIVTYQIRLYEYGIYLQWFMENPQTAPPTRGAAVLNNWAISTRKQTFAEDTSLWEKYPDREKALEYIARSKQLLAEVKRLHPGTPWAARAQWELNRGYGVHVVPDYDVIYNPPSGVPLIPIPKL